MSNLTKSDVVNFAYKNNIILSDDELDFTYSFIKDHYKEILKNKYAYNFDDYKKKFSPENFQKIKSLIDKYISYL